MFPADYVLGHVLTKTTEASSSNTYWPENMRMLSLLRSVNTISIQTFTWKHFLEPTVPAIYRHDTYDFKQVLKRAYDNSGSAVYSHGKFKFGFGQQR
jgi:hypothetical protein